MKNGVFWDIKTLVRTSQETHYVSATELSRLMICKVWGFQGGDNEECRLLGYKTLVRTSQETHYVSSTKPNQLMLCKIWGFHGGDYEEWCLLGYRNPVRTSQETHYVSATDLSLLMLCKVWGLHGGDYKESRLLVCDAVWLLCSVQNLLSSRLLSKNVEVRIYKTIILPVVLYGCEKSLWQ
jgi:hypothetical protein